MKKLLFLFTTVLLAYAPAAFAQIMPPADGESEGDQVLYRNEIQGGVQIHSTGFGIFGRSGRHVTGKRMRFFELEILSMKHPKAYRNVNPFEERARQYVYGKQNSFGIIRPGIGFNNVIHGKDRRRGVEVRYHYFVGPSIGFTKPVYLEIIVDNSDGRDHITEKYDPQRHHLDNIYGKAPFTKGITELGVHPGIYGKFGFSFEYSGYDDYVKAIETGFFIDAYPRKIEMMAKDLTQNHQVFLNFYISFVFGKREFY
ncbi:MAG: hypothetical protein H0X62_08745 [Bacteroidetes bacterium]|nr:hypothetical protein [Bacteroidota bacterium]